MITKKDIFTKTLFQISLYLIEVVSVAYGITYLTNHIEPILSYMEFIERMLMAYTIYQILVVVILSNLNDIERDSCLGYLRIMKMCLLYVESKSEIIKKEIIKSLNYELDAGTFNDIKFRDAYQKLKDNLEVLDRTYVEAEIISAEHCYEMADLNWKFSFILRIFK